MFSATDFTYDGRSSTTYGLKIASFDTEPVENTAVYAPTLTTVKSSKANKFMYAGLKYDSPPTYTFSILSETEIPVAKRAEISAWLIGRKGFKALTFNQTGISDYTYYAIFSNAELIYVNGRLHGFNITATFDSPFVRRTAYVELSASASLRSVTVNVDSDLLDEYVYPTVRFTQTGSSIGTDDTNIKIYNTTDDPSRCFSFNGLSVNTGYVVDNELKTIIGNGQNLLSKFSKKWLRLRPGDNVLSYAFNGIIRIEIATYKMIGF